LRPALSGTSIALVTRRLRLLVLFATGALGLALALDAPRAPVPDAEALVETPPTEDEPSSEQLDHDERPLSCEQARAIVSQVRERLAEPVVTVDDELFAELTVGWLDPHGLWSAAPDTPVNALLYERAPELRRELERRGGVCEQARRIGAALDAWVSETAHLFDESRAYAEEFSAERAYELASSGIFEDDPVTIPARELARELGRRLGSFERAFPGIGELADAARERYFPEFGPGGWERAVLVASVRAYVAVIDPHGEWVPRGEEAALYADDPTLDTGPRLWNDALRTPVGLRVIDAPKPPLEVDDLVLAVDDLPTAGVSIEQVDQLSRYGVNPEALLKRVLVLRQGKETPDTIVVALTDEPRGDEVGGLEVEQVPYGPGTVAVVRIREVHDELGSDLADVVRSFDEGPVPLGMLLDLRGNGGGSTDGACEALGIFLPGAPVFPLLSRGKVVEILRASSPKRSSRYDGPVAALVDERTASAAEMIAGALERYDRGPAVGTRTFGKGCVQEYFEDAAGAGLLRLTTLLYTLPDGSPVQRVGLEPRVLLAPVSETEPEREADLEGALLAQPGPDVRPGRRSFEGPPWPPHRGRVGPCSEGAVCQALRRLGGAQAPARARTPFRSVENGRSRR
jgi:carboxyl-terminal processing protease